MVDEDTWPKPIGEQIDENKNWAESVQDLMADFGMHYVNPELFDLDRPRGILSKTDRKYLVGHQEYKHEQSELNRKQEIRKRIQNGLQDFELLKNYHSIDQREKVLDELDKSELDQYVSSVISYLYKSSQGDVEWLENNINTGIFNGVTTYEDGTPYGDVKSISVDIDIKYEPDVNKIYGKFKDSDSELLRPEEIGLLVRHGKLSEDDIKELDRSDPMKLPAKLERHMNAMRQMVEESDELELIEDDVPEKDRTE